MKKLVVTLITMLALAIPFGVFADEGKAVNTQLTKLELQNDAGEAIKEVSVGSSFKLFANYTINDTYARNYAKFSHSEVFITFRYVDMARRI